MKIPFGEVPGVRRRVMPQGPLRWRCADHGAPSQPELGDKRPCHCLDTGQEIARRGRSETVAGKARRGKKALCLGARIRRERRWCPPNLKL